MEPPCLSNSGSMLLPSQCDCGQRAGREGRGQVSSADLPAPQGEVLDRQFFGAVVGDTTWFLGSLETIGIEFVSEPICNIFPELMSSLDFRNLFKMMILRICERK